MLFVDLRDHTGLTQLRFSSANPAAHEVARSFHNEDVIAVTGTVIARERVNPKLPTGEIEVDVAEIDVLSRADPLPFQVNDEFDTSEEMCLRYRYLHLRRPEMQDKIRLRHRIARAIREYFHENDFVEIETPCLTK